VNLTDMIDLGLDNPFFDGEKSSSSSCKMRGDFMRMGRGLLARMMDLVIPFLDGEKTSSSSAKMRGDLMGARRGLLTRERKMDMMMGS